MDYQGNFEYTYRKWRAAFLRTTLIAACILGLVALIPSLIATVAFYRIIYITLYIIVLLITFLHINDNIRAGILIFLVYMIAVAGLTETGIRGDARLFMLGAITLACMLFSWRAGWVMLGVGLASYILFGWLIFSGRLTISNTTVGVGTLQVWVSNATSMVMLSILVINSMRLSQTEYENSENRARSFFKDLTVERSTLEQKIKERTEVLDKRTSQLQAVADVGKSITSYRNLSELLQQASILIHENFGYYHVGIFLLDERKEYAVLAATNSEGGRRMLDKGHQRL
ncbi:MAG: hypothetical protein HYU84_16680 [Chloroflexi bacterium]|nr:hypothetical protein [Chloroflexota bacterium]